MGEIGDRHAMTALYNEIDPKAAAWLRELIKRGLIAPGVVIEASIEDLTPNDLRGYTQVHFFAGIGVWSYALRAAGWPDDRPVWTGSCPCQPFSAAGKGGGFDDERHLWPAFHYLIDQCRPDVVFGEQVASKDGLGWLDLVQADLEGTGYASGAVDLCAAGVGAPHIRQRLWWFGERVEHASIDGRSDGGVADDQGITSWAGLRDLEPARHGFTLDSNSGAVRGMADLNGDGQRESAGPGVHNAAHHIEPRRGAGGLANDNGGNASAERQQRSGEQRQQPQDGSTGLRNYGPGPTNGLWADADWLHCRDGKWRPVEPGTFPLAHGAPARVGRLRGYGNAINAEAATVFIEAYLEAQDAEADQHLRLIEAPAGDIFS